MRRKKEKIWAPDLVGGNLAHGSALKLGAL